MSASGVVGRIAAWLGLNLRFIVKWAALDKVEVLKIIKNLTKVEIKKVMILQFLF